MPTRIVTSTYRYKRPPRKRKAVPLEGPAIVRKGAASRETPPAPETPDDAPAVQPTTEPRSPAIVTAKRRAGRFGDVPDMTPEEHQRRGDAADALFREMVRRATGKDRSATPAAALAQLRQRPVAHAPPKPWTSRSGRSRRGSCGSPATAAARTGWSTRATSAWRDRALRDILTRMRHDGCGGRAAKAGTADRDRGRQPAGAADRAAGVSVALAVLPRVRGGQSRLRRPNEVVATTPARPDPEDGPAIPKAGCRRMVTQTFAHRRGSWRCDGPAS